MKYSPVRVSLAPFRILLPILTICLISHATVVAQGWYHLSETTLGVTTRISSVPPGDIVIYDRDQMKRSAGNADAFEDCGEGIDDVYDLEPWNSSMVAVGLQQGVPGYGVFISTDMAATFQRLSTPPLQAGALAQIITGSNGRLIVRSNQRWLFLSDDGGATWAEITVPDSVGTMVDADVRGSRWIVAGLKGTAYSQDDGQSWTMMPSARGGIGFGAVRLTDFDIVGGGILGVHKWTGTEWQRVGGLPYSGDLPVYIYDMQVRENNVYVVSAQFGGLTGVYAWYPPADSFIVLDAADFPANHGAQREMLRPTLGGVYLHYVQVGSAGARRGTFVHGEVISSVTEVPTPPASIFPQPASESVSIRLAENADIEVVDMFGVQFFTSRVHDMYHDLDVRTWPAGLYMLRTHATSMPLIVVH